MCERTFTKVYCIAIAIEEDRVVRFSRNTPCKVLDLYIIHYGHDYLATHPVNCQAIERLAKHLLPINYDKGHYRIYWNDYFIPFFTPSVFSPSLYYLILSYYFYLCPYYFFQEWAIVFFPVVSNNFVCRPSFQLVVCLCILLPKYSFLYSFFQGTFRSTYCPSWYQTCSSQLFWRSKVSFKNSHAFYGLFDP